MPAEKTFKLGSAEQGEPEEETQEQLDSVKKRLSDLVSADGTSMASPSRQELSLMKQILTTASEEYKEQSMWRMCDFLDEDEALDHVAAFYEAKDLGMDTGFNVAFMFALVSANRKTSKTNLISQLLNVFHVGTGTSNYKRGNHDGHNPRSPID